MQIRAGLWAVVRGRPLLCIDGLGGAEVKCQLRNNLPTKTEESAASKTVNRRNGVGIEDIVFVAIDTVVPVLGVKELEPEPKAQRCRV